MTAREIVCDCKLMIQSFYISIINLKALESMKNYMILIRIRFQYFEKLTTKHVFDNNLNITQPWGKVYD